MNEPEIREYVVTSEHSAFGRSTVTILCPFCKARIRAYLWSLAGSGKRCTCGALFDGHGRSRAPDSSTP